MSNAMFAYRIFDSGVRFDNSSTGPMTMATDIVRNLSSITVDAAISPFSDIAIVFGTDNYYGLPNTYSRNIVSGEFWLGNSSLNRINTVEPIQQTAFIGFNPARMESISDPNIAPDSIYTIVLPTSFNLNENKYITTINYPYDETNPQLNLTESKSLADSMDTTMKYLMQFFKYSLGFAYNTDPTSSRELSYVREGINGPQFIPIQQLDWVNANASKIFTVLANGIRELTIKPEDLRIYVLEFCQYAMYSDRNTNPLNPDSLPMCSFRSITLN